MRELSFGADAVDSGVLAVSELATNSHQHAGRGAEAAFAELWVWARTYPRAELVVAVFDGYRDAVPRPGNGDALAERGKGLGIVDALAASWGWRLSRSRLADRPVLGKATWFRLPLARPVGERVIAPSVAAERLRVLLVSRGLAATRRSDAAGVSVVSAGGLDIWVTPGWFTWRTGSGYDRRPLLDVQDTVEEAVGVIEARSVFVL